MDDKIIQIYNELLENGIKEQAYYKLIELMDSLNINRDNLAEPLIILGIAKFPVYNHKDGYDIDYCD
jgi:hypothetical protein